VCQDILVARI